jgi:Zn-dependent protease
MTSHLAFGRHPMATATPPAVVSASLSLPTFEDEMSGFARARAACQAHTTTETAMRCGRCEAPVCGACVVLSVVGNRCRNCAPGLERHQPDLPLFGVIRSPRARVAAGLGTMALVAGILVFAWVMGDRDRLIVRSIVFGGGLFSMVLHELAHGLVAYRGGDTSMRTRGFLTLNPLKYMDPVFSVAMPMLFLLLGGIPMIGGRTLVASHNLRSKSWDSAVSLAGPATNIAIAFAIGAAFRAGIIDPFSATGAGLAYLAVLQLAMGIFNLIPVPGFDGYGAIAPHLDERTRRQFDALPPYAGYFLVVAIMWMVPGVSDALWDSAHAIADWLQIEPWARWDGWYLSKLFHRGY